MTRRDALRTILVCGLAIVAVASLLAFHPPSAAARASAAPALEAFVRATGLVDPCMSTVSRANRAPSRALPADALADGPGLRDLDPARALVLRAAP